MMCNVTVFYLANKKKIAIFYCCGYRIVVDIIIYWLIPGIYIVILCVVEVIGF